MRSSGLRAVLALGALAAASGAEAQVIYNQPQAGGYGGGLIELLMTGRNPAASRERYHPAAPSAGILQPQAARATRGIAGRAVRR